MTIVVCSGSECDDDPSRPARSERLLRAPPGQTFRRPGSIGPEDALHENLSLPKRRTRIFVNRLLQADIIFGNNPRRLNPTDRNVVRTGARYPISRNVQRMNCRTRALASLAIALMAAFLSIAPAVAQDATPVAEEAPVAAVAEELRPWVVSDPFTPAPDECTVDAVDVSSLAVSLATPIPVVAPDLTSAGIYALEVTGLADAATIDGVLDTLTLFWACTNAGNRPAVAALMTPAAVSEFYGIDLSLTGDALDEEVANRLVNSGDREEGT